MATLIERAVTVGINAEQAQTTLNILGEAAFEAALKKKEAEPVDYVKKFKDKYTPVYEAAASSFAALKQHIVAFTRDNPDAKLEVDPDAVVKSAPSEKKKRNSTGKTHEKIELLTLATRYAGCTLSYNDNTAELLTDGKVKVGDTIYESPNAWGQAVKPAGTRLGIWYNVIKIDVGEAESISMAKAYSKPKNTPAAPKPETNLAIEPETETETVNSKKK